MFTYLKNNAMTLLLGAALFYGLTMLARKYKPEFALL